MQNEAPISTPLSDQAKFDARIKRYAREQLICGAAIAVFLILIVVDRISVYLIIGAFAAIFRLAYLHVQKKKLLARGPAKSNQDWWDEWDERKKL